MAHWINRSDPETTSSEPSVLIVGAGTFGTSAAYHLAQQYRNASKITIVDRAPSRPKPAAAIDINRVIRTDYASTLYGNLAYEAWHAWFWSMELQPYFHQTGWLMMDDSTDSTLSHAIRQQYRDRGSDPTEDIDVNDILNRWGGMMKGTATGGFQSAYFSSETGWCDAAVATQNLMEAAEKKGVKRVTADITEIVLAKERDRISGAKTMDGKTLQAERILVAAGAWTSALLSPLEDVLQVEANHRIENQARTTGVLQIYYGFLSEEGQRCDDSKLPIIVYGQQGEVIPPHSKHNLVKYTYNHSFTNTVTTNSGAIITCPSGPTYESQLYDIPDALKREAHDNLISRVHARFYQRKGT